MSNHDFDKTPSFDEITGRLIGMKKLGADVAKLACMPNSAKDVLTLLSATESVKSQYPDEPIITMSMGKLGAISRISGEIFGSALTFGSAKRLLLRASWKSRHCSKSCVPPFLIRAWLEERIT